MVYWREVLPRRKKNKDMQLASCKRSRASFFGIVFFGVCVLLVILLWFFIRVPGSVTERTDASDSLEVVREENRDGVDIRLRYPKPSYVSAREYISEEVEKHISDVVALRKMDTESTAPYVVSVNYDTIFDTKHRITTYVVSIVTYTGGAHGMQYFVTASVNTKTGEMITLRDIVVDRSAFWGAVVPFVRNDLIAKGIDQSFITFLDGT
mgnify:CR=1 FL=1